MLAGTTGVAVGEIGAEPGLFCSSPGSANTLPDDGTESVGAGGNLAGKRYQAVEPDDA